MRIPETEEARERRSRFARGLAVAVASLIMANGVIVAQETTGLDFGDAIENSGAALIGLLEFDSAGDEGAMRPDPSTSTTAGVDGTSSSSSSSTATTGATPSTATPGTSAPAEGPGQTSTTKPGGKAGGKTTPTKPGQAPSTPGAAPSEAPVTPGGSTATTSPADTPPPAPTNEQILFPLQTYVAQQRGLAWTGPIQITELSEAPFKARLADYRLGAAREEAGRLEGMMRALGLIAPDVDLVAQVNRLAAGQATAFYDTARNEMFVRGDLTTPFARKTLVHELTNALNDQHFELDRPALRQNDDEAHTAFVALAEGIAARIENRYVLGLSDDDKRFIQAEQQRLAAQFPKDLPSIVFVSFGFPYTAGLRMVNALADAGGPGRLDEALRRPPTTTEQILHPDRYLSGDAGRAIAPPPADGPVLRSGVMGQLDLSLMLAEGLEPDYAEDAADGWAGDRWVSWQGPNGQTCVRLSVEMDTPEDTTVMGEALTDWAGEMPGAVVEGAGPFTVTRCG